MLNIADAPYVRETLRRIQLRARSLTNITTSQDRPHPVVCIAATGPSDSGLFGVWEWSKRLSS